MVLGAFPFYSFADPFLISDSRGKEATTQAEYWVGGGFVTEQEAHDRTCSAYEGTANRRAHTRSTTISATTGRVARFYCHWINTYTNPQGDTSDTGAQETYSSYGSQSTTVSKCGVEAQGLPTDYTFEYNNVCYDPATLSLKDSCGVGSGDILPPDGSTGDVCHIKADNSHCLYEQVTSDSGVSFYTPKTEPASCYSAPIPNQYVEVDNTPPNQDCVLVSGNTYICPESESNVCDATW